MKKLLTTLLVLSLVGCQQASTGASTDTELVESTTSEETDKPEEQKKKKYWTCPTCSKEEQYVLKQFQEKAGITDRNALATLMGNIRSESMFIPNICEGGARVQYNQCHSGGYGLIQWTTQRRYDGLGYFSSKYGCDPSELECQTRYMINELEFQKTVHLFRQEGKSISQYMRAAYYWLGWGIKGYRESYSHEYYAKMVLA